MKIKININNFLLFLLLCFLFLFYSNAFAGINDGLVAYWSFNDCNARDDAEKGHDGVINGSPQCVDRVQGDRSFKFAVGDFDWIRIANADDLNFTAGSSFTLSAFVKPETTTVVPCDESGRNCWAAGAIIVKSPSNTVWNYGLYYDTRARKFFSGWHNNNPVYSNVIEEGHWYHFVVVYENCSWKLYLNSILVSSATGKCITAPSQGALGIGRKGDSQVYADFFQGSIDEVRIYNRALSEEEIKLIYDDINPTIAQTPMSGPPGTTFTERGSGFTHDSTATLHFKKPDGSEYDTKQQIIDNSGNFEIQYRAPRDKPPGIYTWWAIDGPTMMKSNEVSFEITNEAMDFVYPVLGVTQTDSLQNKKNPLTDGWYGKGVGQFGASRGHLGQDYYLLGETAGKPVYAIANGEIVEVLNGPGKYGWCDAKDHGWGPVVVIKHIRNSGFNVTDDAIVDPDNCGTDRNPTVIYSLYGHLSRKSIENLSVGKPIKMGDQIGVIGRYGIDQVKWPKNHLHFEIKDENGFMEGTWYRSHPKECPGTLEQACDVEGIGTAYSYKNGFAPFRYVPAFFIEDNYAPNPTTTTTTTIPDNTTTTTTTISSGPCAAESIYGEHAEETELLRDYRDNVLSKTPEGQEFINTYYKFSPTITKLLERNPVLKNRVKAFIDNMLPGIRRKVEEGNNEQ